MILDGTDNFETRLLINDYSVRHGIPWIYGAAVAQLRHRDARDSRTTQPVSAAFIPSRRPARSQLARPPECSAR